jgi:hypothetical protein
MRCFAFPALVLLASVMLACAKFKTPVPSLSPVEPDSPLAKSMVDAGAGEELVIPNIINGQFSGPGQFPFMAMTSTRSQRTCSSSILAPGYLISVRGGRAGGTPTPPMISSDYSSYPALPSQAAHCFYVDNYLGSGTATMGTNEA